MSKLKVYDGSNWKVVNGQVTGDTLPIGSIVPYGSKYAPTNWLVCDGSAVSRTTYSELFTVIGTSFGSGDGSTTFNLPNLKGKVPVGYNSSDTDFDTMGETGGSKDAVVVEHSHGTLKISSYPGGVQNTKTGYGYEEIALNRSSYGNQTDTTGVSGTGKNLQPYQVVCYIIKAKQSAGVIANVSNVYSGSQANTYSCNYINEAVMDTYSTTEQIIGYWTNGDAIYKKTIVCDPLPDTAGQNYALNIPNLGEVISVSAIAVNVSTGQFFPLPFYRDYDPYGIQIYVTIQNGITITTGNDRTGFKAYVTLEYIKDY